MGGSAAAAAVRDRPRTAFATPRLEVDIVCRLALARYLCSRAPRVSDLVRSLLADDARSPDRGRETSGSAEDWLTLRKALDSIRVVDPACGEGNMLLGMLEILDQLGSLTALHLGVEESARGRRRTIIARNLYGVDVDRAVIAQARYRLLQGAEGGRSNAAILTESPDLRSGPRKGPGAATSVGTRTSSDPRYAPPLQGRGDLSDGAAGAAEAALGRNLACGDSLVESAEFSWQRQFPEVMSSGGFDLVVGNPPFVRHERIEDPLGRLARPEYKRQAAATIHARLARWVANSQGFTLGGRTDLCALFMLAGVSLLRQDGALGFVLPISLFESRYGLAFERVLRGSGCNTVVIESRVRRSFTHAGVNTAILVTSRPAGTWQAGAIKQVRLPTGLEALDLRDADEESTRPSTARTCALPNESAEAIRERLSEKLIPLQSLGQVRYPIKTGNNRFFYPDAAAIERFGIEPEFCRPVLRSPRAVRRIAVRPEDPTTLLFACDRDLEELEADGKIGVLAYIDWGGKQSRNGIPWPDLPSLRGRHRWYTVPVPSSADIICPRFYDRRFFFVLPCGSFLEDQTFYGVRLLRADPSHRDLVAALLNCSLTYLFLETRGRTGLGYGVRQYALCDMADLPVPDPGCIPAGTVPHVLRSFHALASRPILPVEEEMSQPDRLALDEAVGAVLGIQEVEMEGVRTTLIRGVRQRLARATRSCGSKGQPDGGSIPG